MAMKNKYAKRARISEAKIREIVRYFTADLTALQAAALSGLNRNRGGPRFSDRLLRWSPDPTGGIWNATQETELPG